MAYKFSEVAKTAWKDPVLSKLIATGLTAALLFGWHELDASTFGRWAGWLMLTYPIPGWLLSLFSIMSLVGLSRAWPRRKAPPVPTSALISEIVDASAVLDGWWPSAVGSFPDDVSVNYAALEREFCLAPGLAKKAIAIVASKNYYKEKIAGDNHATFQYDHQRAIRA